LRVSGRAPERGTLEDYHQPRNRLDDLRFYLSQPQCDRINAVLDRIDAIPLELHELRIVGTRFAPDPRMDDSYLAD
jgi:hypothetical protein